MMGQDDFNIISLIVLHNFKEYLQFEKNLTKQEKTAKALFKAESDKRRDSTPEQQPIATDGIGTKHVYKDFMADVILSGNQLLVKVYNDEEDFLERSLPLQFGMMASQLRDMPTATFNKNIDKHSKKANDLLNTMNYALVDQFIQFNSKEEAVAHKHALEGVVLYSFIRKVHYYFEFVYDGLLWRYNLDDKRLQLCDSNTHVSIDFTGNTVTVLIEPRVENQLGRLNYTSGQAMTCVSNLLDSISKGFKFNGGYITFHKEQMTDLGAS